MHISQEALLTRGKSPTQSHLRQLQDEAIYLIREVAAQFERPLLLFSGGKDSICLAWLAKKAFAPAPIPFALLHVDTGHNFQETLDFRDRFVADLGVKLHVRRVEDCIKAGRVTEESGPRPSRNSLQTTTLLTAIKELGADACLGGARRDEEKARAKERFFSHRDAFGHWDPKNQRPELWNLYNGRRNPNEHFRVFPLSNWTELDVWLYLAAQGVELPSLYFAHEREVVITSENVILARSEVVPALEGERVERRQVRFRTIGDMTCTGAVVSGATTLQEVIDEVASTRLTERGGRADDKRSQSAMEDRKREGYF